MKLAKKDIVCLDALFQRWCLFPRLSINRSHSSLAFVFKATVFSLSSSRSDGILKSESAVTPRHVFEFYFRNL